MKARSNHPEYQRYADRLYKGIGQQLRGLYYKDGGSVIGIQIENEYWRGKRGEEHILWLKQTAIMHGMDVPLYTVTGWKNASAPQDEVIPLWGGYPAAPWTTNLKKIETNENYTFQAPINDETIGHKETTNRYSPDYTRYPYFTCELGIGNQISEHRRPILSPIDGLAIATAKTGSGSNLPGYYVFAGGSSSTIDAKKNMIYIKIANASPEAVPVIITFEGSASLNTTGIVNTISLTDLTAYNSIENPTHIVPVEKEITLEGKVLNYTLEAHSFNVFEIGMK